jgi:hypothetical protein
MTNALMTLIRFGEGCEITGWRPIRVNITCNSVENGLVIDIY